MKLILAGLLSVACSLSEYGYSATGSDSCSLIAQESTEIANESKFQNLLISGTVNDLTEEAVKFLLLQEGLIRSSDRVEEAADQPIGSHYHQIFRVYRGEKLIFFIKKSHHGKREASLLSALPSPGLLKHYRRHGILAYRDQNTNKPKIKMIAEPSIAQLETMITYPDLSGQESEILVLHPAKGTAVTEILKTSSLGEIYETFRVLGKSMSVSRLRHGDPNTGAFFYDKTSHSVCSVDNERLTVGDSFEDFAYLDSKIEKGILKSRISLIFRLIRAQKSEKEMNQMGTDVQKAICALNGLSTGYFSDETIGLGLKIRDLAIRSARKRTSSKLTSTCLGFLESYSRGLDLSQERMESLKRFCAPKCH